MGGYAQKYAFPCVHVLTDSSQSSDTKKLEVVLDVRVRVSVCVVPVQNAEREAPSCEAEAACQCCPSGTDTRGASGPPNRLLG